jgi:hypothetical protein
MPQVRGMFVGVSKLYSDLAEHARGYESAVLRNTTCCWWRVTEQNASNVAFLFGVCKGQVVSAYRVVAPFPAWPTLPKGAEGELRKAVPVAELSKQEWDKALTWVAPRLRGPSTFSNVEVDAAGNLKRLL